MNKIKMNILTRAATFVAAVVVLACLPSCGVKYEETEIIPAAAELIEASYEINTIYFGTGLPTVEPQNEDIFEHLEIAEDSPYHTIDEIKEATLAVYTEEYSAFLFEKAFTGFSVEYEDDGEVDEAEIIDARYVEYNDRLVVLPIDEEDILELDRTYDTENINVVSQKRGRVTLSVPSFVDGVPDENVDLTVIKTDDGWRLDSPTY